MISKCPDETLLVEYASGALSTAPSIAVTTHLKYCDKCRNAVSALGFIGGSLLECLEEEEVSEGLLAQVLDRIETLEDSPSAESKKQSTTVDPVASGLPRICQKPASEREAQLEESHQFARGCAYTDRGKGFRALASQDPPRRESSRA